MSHTIRTFATLAVTVWAIAIALFGTVAFVITFFLPAVPLTTAFWGCLVVSAAMTGVIAYLYEPQPLWGGVD